MLDLSKFGEDAQSGLQTTPVESLNGLLRFLDKEQENPLLKENRKHVGLILRKMAENLGDFAEGNNDLKAIAEGHRALDESNKYAPSNAEGKAIAEKLDQLKIKIVRDQKRRKVVDELEKFVAADGPPEILKTIRAEIRLEKLEEEPEIVAKLKEVDASLRSRIHYVEMKDSPIPLSADRIEPSLLVLPFTATSPQPKSDQRRVVLALDRGVLYALDEFTGKFLWAIRVGIDTTALPVRFARSRYCAGNVSGPLCRSQHPDGPGGVGRRRGLAS